MKTRWFGQKRFVGGSRLSDIANYRTSELVTILGVILLYVCAIALAAGFGG